VKPAWIVFAVALAACRASARLSSPPTAQPTVRPTPNLTAVRTATTIATASPLPTAVPTPTPIPTATPEPGFVSREMFGDAWPLTVESGVLICTTANGGDAVLFRATLGLLYTVNGTAKTEFPDLPDIDPIWAAGTYARR
jgi:hypothetical protein